nr:MAG TPA: Protein of unknown function (DUF1376) [Caudoviricetes sp.]
MSAPFMQLYVADYLGDTRHLTTEQHGAYLLLLMTMWRSDGVLPKDDAKLARIVGMSVARWKRISDDVLAFFDDCEGGITQGRLAAELAISEEKSEKRSLAGRLGGRAKSLKDKKAAVANATAMPCHSPEPEPEVRIEAKASISSSAKPTTYPEPFEAAWKAYPHIKGRSSKPKALGLWRRLPTATREALPSAVARYARDGREPKAECGAPAMQRWLSEARFEDWMMPDAKPASVVGTVDPALLAYRLQHFAKTGEWKPTWGNRPAANDHDHHGAAA